MLYLERPPRNRAQQDGFSGALLIQRLEGSRPHGGLCALNGADRVQGLGEVTVQCMIRPVEGGTDVRSVAQRRDVAAGMTSGRGVFAS